jgi:hypothetical protein
MGFECGEREMYTSMTQAPAPTTVALELWVWDMMCEGRSV